MVKFNVALADSFAASFPCNLAEDPVSNFVAAGGEGLVFAIRHFA